jgi:prolipoprotein diacylglyceryltransferase
MYLGQFPPILHYVFETLAFMIGGLIYFKTKKKDSLTADQRPWVVVGGCLGAAVGCKLIFWLEDPQWLMEHLSDWASLSMGKSLVGALVGGWIGVEIAKAKLGVKTNTGDSFVVPLMAGIIVGRIGCFLTGFFDHTYGVATSLPWGVDFGDGVQRHPTQLYEIAWLLIWLQVIVWRAKCCPYSQGDLFKLFMLGYMGFRFLVEFLKPVAHAYAGLDIEQVVAIIVYVYYLPFIVSGFVRKPQEEPTK